MPRFVCIPWLAAALFCAPLTAQVNLLTARSYPVGSGPRNVAAADLNADGKPDLVTANDNDTTISVLLNNGDGTFRSGSTYTVGANPYDVVVGDFNGDGKPDLGVAPCGAAGTTLVCLLLGNGDGTFQSPVDYGTSATPVDLAAADFNGDGKLDIAVTTPNGVDVLLGNGDGTFASPRTISLGTYALYPTVGDFNRDGKQDLAVIAGNSANNYKLKILLGNGDGTFSAGAVYSQASTGVFGIGAVDLNMDAKLDLVLSNYGAGLVAPAVLVMLGNGDGTFSGPIGYGSAIGPEKAVAGDFNADGKPDIGVVDSTTGVVHILLGNGDGTLRTEADFLVSGQDPVGLALADFNGDGRSDLATANLVGSVSVLIGNADGTFQAARDYSLGTVGNGEVISVVLGDFNQDGKLDFATGQNNTLGLGNGDGTFALTNWTGNGGLGITAADFNRDGHLDIAAATSAGPGPYNVDTAVYLGSGNGTFQPERDFSQLSSSLLWIATGDFNGDGNLDLVQSGTVTGGTIDLGDGTGNFSDLTYTPRSYQPVVADLNGDGRADIVYPNGTLVDIALSNPDGTSEISTLPYAVNIVNVAAADINGDGKIDLVGVDFGNPQGHAVVLLGNGDGTFQSPVNYPVGTDAQAVAIGDINGDGHPDIVVAALYEVDILLGNGDGTFQAPVSFGWSGSAVAMAVAIGDLNGDGLPDIVTERATGASESITVFLNETGVVPAIANISLVSSLNPAASSQAVQLTATVSPKSGSGVPTGTITFLNGSTSLGQATLSGGSASMTTSALAVGNDSLTASYSGDRFFAGGSSTALVQVINAYPFTVTPTTSSSATVTAGQTAAFALTLTPGTAQSQTVSLTCGTAPPNSTCTISPSSVGLNGSAGSATVTIQTSAAALAATRTPNNGVPWITYQGRMGVISFLALLCLCKRRKRTLVLAFLPVALTLLGSCGGGNSGGSSHGTPTGTYTIVVTAQAGSSIQTINLKLTVQ